MTNSHIKNPGTIVFDLGGVLIDWNPHHLYKKMFNGNDRQMEYFLAEVCNFEWNARQDEGRPFAEAIAERTEKFPEYSAYIEAFFSRWDEMVSGSLGGTVTLLRSLKEKGYPLFALSNWSAETYPRVYQRFDFLSWFDDVILSGEERVAKPDQRIYEILLQRSGRAASECLFIDDAAKNIEAARVMGFHTVHFTDSDQLKDELTRMKFLP